MRRPSTLQVNLPSGHTTLLRSSSVTWPRWWARRGAQQIVPRVHPLWLILRIQAAVGSFGAVGVRRGEQHDGGATGTGDPDGPVELGGEVLIVIRVADVLIGA